VAAKVQMRVQPSLSANHDYTLAGDVEHAVRTRLLELLASPDIEPLVPEDRLLFPSKESGIPIGRAGKRRLKPFGQPLLGYIIRRSRHIFRRFHRSIYQKAKRIAALWRIPSNRKESSVLRQPGRKGVDHGDIR
jgi:hypothetical protein